MQWKDINGFKAGIDWVGWDGVESLLFTVLKYHTDCYVKKGFKGFKKRSRETIIIVPVRTMVIWRRVLVVRQWAVNMGEMLNEELTGSIDRVTTGWQGKGHQARARGLVLSFWVRGVKKPWEKQVWSLTTWGPKNLHLNWVWFVTVRRQAKERN